VQLNASAVLAHLEGQYTSKVLPIMTKVRKWKDEEGEYFAVTAFKDQEKSKLATDYIRVSATDYMRLVSVPCPADFLPEVSGDAVCRVQAGWEDTSARHKQ
jgi:hypothetical protein